MLACLLEWLLQFHPQSWRGMCCCLGLKRVQQGSCQVVERGVALLGFSGFYGVCVPGRAARRGELGSNEGLTGYLPSCGARRGAARVLRVSRGVRQIVERGVALLGYAAIGSAGLVLPGC